MNIIDEKKEEITNILLEILPKYFIFKKELTKEDIDKCFIPYDKIPKHIHAHISLNFNKLIPIIDNIKKN